MRICSIRGLAYGSKDYTKELKTVGCTIFLGQTSWFRPISEPQISSKLQNGINGPKGLENKVDTMIKNRETFYSDHTVPITSCSEVQYVL